MSFNAVYEEDFDPNADYLDPESLTETQLPPPPSAWEALPRRRHRAVSRTLPHPEMSTSCGKPILVACCCIIFALVIFVIGALVGSSFFNSFGWERGNRTKRDTENPITQADLWNQYIGYAKVEQTIHIGKANLSVLELSLPMAKPMFDDYKEALRSTFTAIDRNIDVYFHATNDNGTITQYVCTYLNKFLLNVRFRLVIVGRMSVSDQEVRGVVRYSVNDNSEGDDLCKTYVSNEERIECASLSSIPTQAFFVGEHCGVLGQMSNRTELLGVASDPGPQNILMAEVAIVISMLEELKAYNLYAHPDWRVAMSDDHRGKRCVVFIINWSCHHSDGVTSDYVDKQVKSLRDVLHKENLVVTKELNVLSKGVSNLYGHIESMQESQTMNFRMTISLGSVGMHGYFKSLFHTLDNNVREWVKFSLDLKTMGKLEVAMLPNVMKAGINSHYRNCTHITPIQVYVSQVVGDFISIMAVTFCSQESATLVTIEPLLPALVDGALRMPNTFQYIHDGTNFYEPVTNGVTLKEMFDSPLGRPPNIIKRTRINGIIKEGIYMFKARKGMPRAGGVHTARIKGVCYTMTVNGRKEGCKEETFTLKTVHTVAQETVVFQPGTVNDLTLPDHVFDGGISEDFAEFKKNTKETLKRLDEVNDDVASWMPSGFHLGHATAANAVLLWFIFIVLVVEHIAFVCYRCRTRLIRTLERAKTKAVFTKVAKGDENVQLTINDVLDAEQMENNGEFYLTYSPSGSADDVKRYKARKTGNIVLVKDPIRIGGKEYANVEIPILQPKDANLIFGGSHTTLEKKALKIVK